eukprot:1162015-Pelagomonas_calceolata.AAC.19
MLTFAQDTSDGPADDHDLRAPEILQGTPEIFHPSLEAPARLPGSGSTHVQKDFVKADHFCTDGALPNKRSVPVQTDHFCPDSAFLYTRSVPVQTEHSPEHFQVPAPASHPSQPALCWESLAGLLETIPFALAITTSVCVHKMMSGIVDHVGKDHVHFHASGTISKDMSCDAAQTYIGTAVACSRKCLKMKLHGLRNEAPVRAVAPLHGTCVYLAGQVQQTCSASICTVGRGAD